jgi:hypothetical protein
MVIQLCWGLSLFYQITNAYSLYFMYEMASDLFFSDVNDKIYYFSEFAWILI